MIWVTIIAAIIALDQVTKYIVATKLQEYDTIPLLENIFHFTFVKNSGAAFGILQEKRWIFITITIIVIIGMIYYLMKNRPSNMILKISMSMILGGAIGNLIDRIMYGYVIDFLDFTLISWPVFNVADSFVVIGTILLSYFLIFKYEEVKEIT